MAKLPTIKSKYPIIGRHYNTSSGAFEGYELYPQEHVRGEQIINYTHRKKGRIYKDGGNWLSVRSEVRRSGNPQKVYRGGHSVEYEGIFRDNRTNTSIQDGWGWGTPEAIAHFNATKARGAEAYNLLRPDNPDFSLALSLYELKDLPGMFRDALGFMSRRIKKKAGRRRLSKAGEYHLAIQFGWLPLVRDIQAFTSLQTCWQVRLAQLIKDAGKPVYRRRNMGITGGNPVSNHGNSVAYDKVLPILNTFCYDLGKRQKWTEEYYTQTSTWAAGKFRYYLPSGPRNVEWTKKMKRRIFGFRVTPSMVYNAMPWTWLLDYFGSLGEFVNAISAGVADNLVCEYAYIMSERHKVMRHTREVPLRGLGNSGATAKVRTDADLYIKARVKATPFGFGMKESDLSPKQLGILGALGLSRLPV